ncbi:hypothetical protein BANRA_04900 [Escherichia coli]|nr:hypothetical protein BANRA_04900 [Escherichia coli]
MGVDDDQRRFFVRFGEQGPMAHRSLIGGSGGMTAGAQARRAGEAAQERVPRGEA